MRTMKPIHDATCSVAACAEIIGAKWTALLVHDLSEGPRRFSELEHSCAGISPRTLSERLRALEDEGIIGRQSYPESPPRVEYELTPKGEALLPIITEMRIFGHEWTRDVYFGGLHRLSREEPGSAVADAGKSRGGSTTRAPSRKRIQPL